MAGERQKAAQRARFREVAADVMDIGRGYSDRQGGSSVLDGATDLAVAAATRATAAGRPLRPNERRQIRHEVLGEQPGQPEQAQRQRLADPRAWLEAMTSQQRRNVETTSYYRKLNAEQQARLLRLRDDVDEIDERAETLLAQEREDAWLEESEDEGPEEDESEEEFGAWDESMTVEQAFGLEAPEEGASLSEEAGWPE